MRASASAVAGALLLAPAVAGAQAYQCAAPASPPRVRPELPGAREPARLLPIGGYTLAVSWSPEFCHNHLRDPQSRFQCGGEGGRFGWTLHGLWPDGVGPTWPQYCKATGLLPPKTLAANMCATPSAQLLQHEWAKHGTCTGLTPDAYFARSTGLYGKLAWPDMARLASERRSTAGSLAEEIARVNPGVPAEAIRVTADRQGWLQEVWFCLDKALRYTRCRADSGGVAAGTALKIARPYGGRGEGAGSYAGRSYGGRGYRQHGYGAGGYSARPYGGRPYDTRSYDR